MWKALSARDWDSLKTFLSDDCIYLDMPVGPAAAARGPEDIVKRLKIGLEPLASYENFDGLMVDNGTDVMYEHHEEWHWTTGESAVLQFVTVHRVENGKITLWKDYWDMGGAGQLRPADLAGGLRQRRHVVDVRRDRPGLRRNHVRSEDHRRDRRRRNGRRPVPRRRRHQGRPDRRGAQAKR